ncbi:helix-turn-helix domain-containing protein [Fibrisoma limi]|nr:AraC family transcriptional regulator [Fibrisoma limi]
MEAIPSLKLNLLHCGALTVGPEWQFNGVVSPFCRLYFIQDGEAYVWHNQQKYTLKPGNLYLIPSYSISRYHCDNTLSQYYLHFLEETETGLSIFDYAAFEYELPALPLDEYLFERLLLLNPERTLANIDPKAYDNQSDLLSFNAPKPDQWAGAGLETQGIMLQLVSRFIQKTKSASPVRQQGFIQFRTVLSYIHTHLSKKITVEQLAALQHLHVDYFSRQFQALLGIRPIDYIINKRLERAQLLMATTSLSLQSIAEQVGIADIYYFSRLFKRRYGLPPGTYRKQSGRV